MFVVPNLTHYLPLVLTSTNAFKICLDLLVDLHKKLFQFCNKVDHSNENGNWNWMEVGSAVVGVTIDVIGIKIYFRYIME